jgi:hypothetical protein
MTKKVKNISTILLRTYFVMGVPPMERIDIRYTQMKFAGLPADFIRVYSLSAETVDRRGKTGFPRPMSAVKRYYS